MKTDVPPAENRRQSIILASLTLLVILGVVVWAFLGTSNTRPINGQKIIAAAHAYTRVLRESHAQPQVSVPLQTLIDKGFLNAADVGSLQGQDAQVLLVAAGKPAAIMQVKMTDGTVLVLFEDGSIRQGKL